MKVFSNDDKTHTDIYIYIHSIIDIAQTATLIKTKFSYPGCCLGILKEKKYDIEQKRQRRTYPH